MAGSAPSSEHSSSFSSANGRGGVGGSGGGGGGLDRGKAGGGAGGGAVNGGPASSVLAMGLLCGNGMGVGALLEDGGGERGGGGRGGGVLEAGMGSAPPRSGVKTFTYEDSGDTYTGSWRNGRRHGVGVYEERATGNSYEVMGWCG